MHIIGPVRGKPILKAIALSLLLATTGTVGVRGQDQPSTEELLKRLEQLSKEGEKFQSHEFRLLWAREAYLRGNQKGAVDEWIALAEEGNPTAGAGADGGMVLNRAG
jgi:hypothetical protein